MKKNNQFSFKTKLMAIILCILMIVTLAVTSIYMLIDLIKGGEETTDDGHKHEAAIVEAVPEYYC